MGQFEGEVPPRQIPSGGSIPLGPGVNVRFPDDPGLAPLLGSEDRLGPAGSNRAALVSPDLIDNVRMITVTYDRSRALQELAREAILSNQLLLAHRTLLQASTAALEERNALRHDQLIIEIITTTGQLTETLIREGRTQLTMLEPQEGRPEPLPQRLNPKLSIRLARLEWQRARVLARAIINPTYRSEYLARVAEGLGRDSSRVVLEYVRRSDIDSAPQAETLTEAEIKEVETSADDYLVEAEQVCQEIDRPIWKNTALERTAINAGESQQYPRAFSIARSIQNAEARSQALILVAESQCRHRQAVEATKTYAEVAEAVARVDLDGLRGVLTGYLVDSLISTGRFEDARACVVLYPMESERFVAMGAVAESEARRGSAERARQWIASDAPPAWRPALYRRVNSGVLAKIGNSRQSLFSGREGQPPAPPQ
jgi:ribosomal protein S13